MSRLIALAGCLLLVLGVNACLTSTSQAATMFFGGPDASKASMPLATAERDRFLDALDEWDTEDLESLSGANPTLDFSGIGNSGSTGFSNGVFSLSLFAVSGSKFMWDTEGEDDFIQFEEPVTAFGTYIVQGGDGPLNEITITIEDTNDIFNETLDPIELRPSWTFFNVIFVGVISETPFDRISFNETYDYDGLLYDDLIAGNISTALISPIPEPSSMLLALTGLAILGVRSRTRQ